MTSTVAADPAAASAPRPSSPAAASAASGRRPLRRRSSCGTAPRCLAQYRQDVHAPEALIDVTLQPIIFLILFVYVFGGAIAGGTRHDYLQFLLPGLLGQTIAMARVALGREPQRRHREGRLRPVPVACRSRVRRRCVGAVLADVVRYLLLCVIVRRVRLPARLPDQTDPASAVAALAAAIALRAVLLLGVGVRRHEGAGPGAVQGS